MSDAKNRALAIRAVMKLQPSPSGIHHLLVYATWVERYLKEGKMPEERESPAPPA
jgi:hypothetical protein